MKRTDLTRTQINMDLCNLYISTYFQDNVGSVVHHVSHSKFQFNSIIMESFSR